MARERHLEPTEDNTTAGLTLPDGAKEIWIFGFGSLIWKADFQYKKRVEGCIKDFKRVFYQGSTDHRGTPFSPGRTVTLEPCPGAVVWGAAYLLAGDIDQQRETLKYLEWREKQYDVRHHAQVFSKENNAQPLLPLALVYIASPDRLTNRNYLGPAEPEQIARQIATAYGPSGPNSEYLFRLVGALRQMGPSYAEEELEWLDRRVRELIDIQDPESADYLRALRRTKP